MEKQKRPPKLSDSLFTSVEPTRLDPGGIADGSQCRNRSADMQTGQTRLDPGGIGDASRCRNGSRGMQTDQACREASAHGCHEDFQRCVRQLRGSFDEALQRHEEELQRFVDMMFQGQCQCHSQPGARQGAEPETRREEQRHGSRRAPEVCRPSRQKRGHRRGASCERRLGRPCAPLGPMSPAKLPPPPCSRTPVQALDGGVESARCFKTQGVRADAADELPSEAATEDPHILFTDVELLDERPLSPASSTRTSSSQSQEDIGFQSRGDTSPDPSRPPSTAWTVPRQPNAIYSRGASGSVECPVKRNLSTNFHTAATEMQQSSDVDSGADLAVLVKSATFEDDALTKDKMMVSMDGTLTKRYRMESSGSGAFFSPLSKRKSSAVKASQPPLLRFTKSHLYSAISTVLIVLNALFVVGETQSRALLARAPGSTAKDVQQLELRFGIVAFMFSMWFCLDWVLRLTAERRHFFYSREWRWNVFDIVVSMTGILEVLVHWYQYMFASSTTSHVRMFLRKFTMLRIARLLGVIRTTRDIRVIRFIRELRLMVFSLTGSLKSLAWAVVLMLIVLLVFGVSFTDGTVAYCVEHDAFNAEHTQDLRRYFGTLFASTASLYMAMSGGEDWGVFVYALSPLPPEYQVLFVVFITFAILALLNVVTAVFVGTAMQRTQADRELMVQQELENKGEFMALMQQVFDELDTDKSGALCFEEFEKHIDDEKIMAYLRTLEVDITQVRTLFTLLDVDRTGEVDINEFVCGCLRLRGGATSIDVAVLKYQVEWLVRNMQGLSQRIETQFLTQQAQREQTLRSSKSGISESQLTITS